MEDTVLDQPSFIEGDRMLPSAGFFFLFSFFLWPIWVVRTCAVVGKLWNDLLVSAGSQQFRQDPSRTLSFSHARLFLCVQQKP